MSSDFKTKSMRLYMIQKQIIYAAALVVMLFPLHAGAKGLSAAQARQEADRLKAQWRQEVKAKYEKVWWRGRLDIDDHSMRFDYKKYGKKPADGYSLYISLHGGGSAPSQTNDRLWENQITLYAPNNAIYLAPRAPYDDWDMWFKPGLDDFYQKLIEMAVAIQDVNPDKVYLMGYSAGGDGVWRMAPRMADAWAAASMMAGHPGDVSLVNLRNLPFMNWCGELDEAYNRNRENIIRGKELDSLQQADPEGYIHETHIVAGKPHWMDRVDTAAVSWMEKYRRDPYPKKIVWQQEEVLRPYFYWLAAPQDELARGKNVRLQLTGNEVIITQCDYSSLTLYFNDEMVDLDRPIVIKYKDKTLFKGRLQRTASNLESTLHARGDYRYMFPASVNVII